MSSAGGEGRRGQLRRGQEGAGGRHGRARLRDDILPTHQLPSSPSTEACACVSARVRSTAGARDRRDVISSLTHRSPRSPRAREPGSESIASQTAFDAASSLKPVLAIARRPTPAPISLCSCLLCCPPSPGRTTHLLSQCLVQNDRQSIAGRACETAKAPLSSSGRNARCTPVVRPPPSLTLSNLRQHVRVLYNA